MSDTDPGDKIPKKGLDGPDAAKSNPMWGGRFSAPPDPILQAINVSIHVDRRLVQEDVQASIAHARMLGAKGIVSAEDCEAILAGLAAIEIELAEGRFPFREEFEDIHMNVEARLRELIGPAAGRLHTARSRNDQVATDFRLWIRKAFSRAEEALARVMASLIARAEGGADWIMPGFTHLQTAQPVTLGHHLMAYVEMFGRDRDRFKAGRRRANECPLGAAALAGTGYPIDRDAVARELDFDRPMANSMDAVSARDFALDYLAAAAISAIHASRLAEEIVLWTSPQFGFATLSSRWSTGSSIMPQKRNPDAAELARAKAARLIADFTALAGILKALPLAYSKDLQDDKAITFAAADSFELTLAALDGMVLDLAFDRDAMRAAAEIGFSTATDLADYLVRDLGLPFRDAHHAAGAIVKHAEGAGQRLEDVALEAMQAIEPRIDARVHAILGVEQSVRARASFGGTAPDQVRAQAQSWRAVLEKERS